MYKKIKINTALRPPIRIREKAVGLSEKIAKDYRVHFVLDDSEFHPHITLYSTLYSESNIEEISEVVGEIAQNNESLDIEFVKVNFHNGYVGVVFKKSPEILKLHKETIRVLSPFREREEEQTQANNYKMNFSETQKKNIEEYGYPDAMELFNPHLTITRLKNYSTAEQVARETSWEINKFQSSKLALFKMNEHGTCQELIGEFTLKNNSSI